MIPPVHDLVTTVSAPAVALCTPDGDIGASGTGVYIDDRRVVSLSRLRARTRLIPLRRSEGVAAATFVSTPQSDVDPGVLVERVRTVRADAVTETISISCLVPGPVEVELTLEIGCDLADVTAVRDGRDTAALAPLASGRGLTWRATDGTRVRALVSGAEVVDGAVRMAASLDAGQTARARVRWQVDGGPPVPFTAVRRASGAPVAVGAYDERMRLLVAQSRADLAGLQLADEADRFYAAGAPWYLTLFGRDAVWAARFTLAFEPEMAAGTLRALARRQGSRVDDTAAEQPGKIAHEVRRAELTLGPMRVPAVYYGTVDATPLWITLLHDAWCWGMSRAEVAALLPALQGALGWLQRQTGDGFLRYADPTGHGLANQGWKDSVEAVQFADGRYADAPIALCEVQGYAHAAARDGARLLDAFGRPGAEQLRDWAAALRDRFRESFWVNDPNGDYPAIALDGAGRPVDGAASNMAHLLGTDLLDAAEEAAVVRRLAGADLNSGFGLRTLSARVRGYNPLGYHIGAVWPHDTAIAVGGLRAVGTPQADALAGDLTRGVLAAGAAFGYRLPELYAGTGDPPLPFPAACRPQAWSAAAALELLRTSLGVRADLPAGVVRLAPLAPNPLGPFTVRLPAAGLDVEVDRAGEVQVSAPPGLRVEVNRGR